MFLWVKDKKGKDFIFDTNDIKNKYFMNDKNELIVGGDFKDEEKYKIIKGSSFVEKLATNGDLVEYKLEGTDVNFVNYPEMKTVIIPNIVDYTYEFGDENLVSIFKRNQEGNYIKVWERKSE